MYNLTFDHTKTDCLEISREQIKAAFDTLDEKRSKHYNKAMKELEHINKVLNRPISM